MIDNENLKPEPWSLHLLGLGPVLAVISGNVVGGAWVLSGIVYMLVIAPILDLVFGRATQPRPPRDSGRPFEALLYVHAALQFAAVSTLLYRAGLDAGHWTMWGGALSTGVSSGVSGIIVAHELGHRKPRSLGWWIGRINLLTVLYLHFTTEHNHTHHRHVSTTIDPASARRGESLWAFVIRTIPSQFQDAARVHATRGKTGLQNPVHRGAVVQIVAIAGVWSVMGISAVSAFLAQALFAIFLLEYINYIRHYGLHREVGERQTEMHSWQSEERWSRWTLLELTRHPAHHLKASVPFWELRPYPNAPTLPTGYYGCFWLAVVPPLWRRMMDGRIPSEIRNSAVD